MKDIADKNKTLKYLLILFSVLVLPGNFFAQENPLFSSSSNDTIQESHYESNVKPTTSEHTVRFGFFNRFIRKNARLQKEIKDKFVSLSKDYKTKKSLKTILLVFLFSFVYGILHSLGPGHGKVFIFSYILTTKPKILKAISISYLIAAIHSLSGLIVALIVVFSIETFSSACPAVNDVSSMVTRLGFAMLGILGIILFIRNISGKEHHHHALPDNDNKRLIPFVLSIGLVPCPGIIIIVTFLASMNLFLLSIASVFFIILGMGITISLIGLISLFSKQLVLRLVPQDSKIYDKTYRYFSLIGAALLVLFGVWFFVGSFYM